MKQVNKDAEIKYSKLLIEKQDLIAKEKNHDTLHRSKSISSKFIIRYVDIDFNIPYKV